MEILKNGNSTANAATGNFYSGSHVPDRSNTWMLRHFIPSRRQASGRRTVDYIDASLKHITLIVKQDKVERRPCVLC